MPDLPDLSTLPTVVVGAGAAGLMAAGFAAERGRDVLVIEGTRQGGKKIVISGGGRCNVLPSAPDLSRFVTHGSPNTLRRVLKSWPAPEQRAFFEQTLGIPLAIEDETGKLFPVSNRATDVRDALLDYARRCGARLVMDTRVSDIQPQGDGSWRVHTGGDVLHAQSVVLATGGLSVPKTGSDGVGLSIARRLGHTIRPTYAALTPLLDSDGRHADLSGLSLTAHLRATGKRAHNTSSGGFLFTHRGYSGPSVLDVSHHAVQRPGARIEAAWSDLDAADWESAFANGRARQALTLVREHLPTRLADALVAEAGIPSDRRCAELRKHERRALIDALTAYPLPHTGDEGYKKAEVTGGGVALGQVNARSMESRLHRGLYFCGEILDAWGPIGGYNFFWAWATGRLAGLSA